MKAARNEASNGGLSAQDVRNNGEPIRVYLNGRRLSFLSTDRPYFSGGTVPMADVGVQCAYAHAAKKPLK